MDGAAEWVLRLVDEHAEVAIFFWLLLEEAGIPMPLPGDLAAVLAGIRVGQGRMQLWLAVLLIEAATVLGASVLFWVARRGGRPLLVRYGRFLQLDADRLARTEALLQRRGLVAVIVGRMVPGFRITTTVAAGALGVRYRTFLVGTAVGSNNIIFFLLGMWAGPEVLAAIHGVRISTRLVAGVLSLAGLVVVFVVLRRRTHLVSAAPMPSDRLRLEVGVIAGLLGTATAALVLNLALYVLAALDQAGPTEALLALGGLVGRRAGASPLVVLAVGMSLYAVLGLGWAVLYARIERRLPRPDWLGGLLFALAPLAVSLLVILPLAGAGVAGLGLGMGLVPLAGEVLRHAIYGWALAVSFTLVSRARAGSPVPESAPSAAPLVEGHSPA
jgi:membrane protein DedA with SNARE-associated domain